MSKTYLMPGTELTPEEKAERSELIKQEDAQRDDLRKKRWAEEVEKDKTKKFVTLEILLKTRISPQEDRVLIWPDPVALVTEGGIFKPDEAIDKERPLTGTVIAVGPGKKVEEKVTHAILLNILQFGTDIPQHDFEKFKEQVFDINIPYASGERVMYGRFAGTSVQDPDTKTELLIMRPHDIFAKI